MLQIIQKLFAGEAVSVTEAVISPPNFSGPKLPPVDAIEELSDGGEAARTAELIENLVNRAFVIVYEDADGFGSERRIKCKNVYTSTGNTYLQAICLERSAPRLFRVDRIQEVYCGATGEDLGAPVTVFIAWGPDRPRRLPKQTKSPLTEIRQALRVLATLARCDGSVHVSEEQAIRAFIEANCPVGTSVDEREELIDYGLRLAPDYGSFVSSFEALLKSSLPLVPHVLMAAIDVAEADGHWHTEEVETIKFLIDVAQEGGVKVEIDL